MSVLKRKGGADGVFVVLWATASIACSNQAGEVKSSSSGECKGGPKMSDKSLGSGNLLKREASAAILLSIRALFRN